MYSIFKTASNIFLWQPYFFNCLLDTFSDNTSKLFNKALNEQSYSRRSSILFISILKEQKDDRELLQKAQDYLLLLVSNINTQDLCSKDFFALTYIRQITSVSMWNTIVTSVIVKLDDSNTAKLKLYDFIDEHVERQNLFVSFNYDLSFLEDLVTLDSVLFDGLQVDEKILSILQTYHSFYKFACFFVPRVTHPKLLDSMINGIPTCNTLFDLLCTTYDISHLRHQLLLLPYLDLFVFDDIDIRMSYLDKIILLIHRICTDVFSRLSSSPELLMAEQHLFIDWYLIMCWRNSCRDWSCDNSDIGLHFLLFGNYKEGKHKEINDENKHNMFAITMDMLANNNGFPKDIVVIVIEYINSSVLPHCNQMVLYRLIDKWT